MNKFYLSMAVCLAVTSLWAAPLSGPFIILSVPYHEDGALDYDTILKEAEFVVDCGAKAFIWAQSNDAIDLLTLEEKKRSFEILAKAFQGRDVVVALGCQGRDAAAMENLARHVEELAVRYPTTQLVTVTRPPHDACTQDDLDRCFRSLAKIAKRPVVIQTYASEKAPLPDTDLMIRLAREFPDVYGWIKEETGDEDATARMTKVASAPEIKTVFSAWGGYAWLDQHRRFGTRGIVSERAAYADLLVKIWQALEKDDRAMADELFSKFLLMLNLKETIPGGHLRGFNLYVLKKRGIFKNCVSRDYVEKNDVSGKWKLVNREFTPGEIAEIEDRFSRLAPYLKK
ncbi:MAG: dihydrodipicolinate synthase family protein [Kiritimatiellae bacterium]|nr:dihydrodipicolinate synthase family protein [Kiritimatiellia bacterium]